MCTFELGATATDCPRYSPGGSLRKFATEVKGIAGKIWALAFCCASAGAAPSMRAIAETDAIQRFMKVPPGTVGELALSKAFVAAIYAKKSAASTHRVPVARMERHRNPGAAGWSVSRFFPLY